MFYFLVKIILNFVPDVLPCKLFKTREYITVDAWNICLHFCNLLSAKKQCKVIDNIRILLICIY